MKSIVFASAIAMWATRSLYSHVGIVEVSNEKNLYSKPLVLCPGPRLKKLEAVFTNY